MRITGGSLQGRHIQCPDGVIRPAMDKMRESFFSILGPLEGKSFLDLFSGSGIIAIEAASRGAERIVLCEKDKIKVDTLLNNVSITEEIGKKIECKFMAVELLLKRYKETFDIIFFDPPFPYKHHQDLVRIVDQRKLLNKGGLLLIHRPQERKMAEKIGDLHKKDTRSYGHSILEFYSY